MICIKYFKYLMFIIMLMARISLTYIFILIIFSFFFLFMTLKYPNYFNQFADGEKIEKISNLKATHPR
mgnify:FL=1